MFSFSAWGSWQRLHTTNRIAQVADASASMFKAMTRTRGSGTSSNRILLNEDKLDGEEERFIRRMHDGQMQAIDHALEVLPAIGFAQQDTLVPEFDRLFKTLTAQQTEFFQEMAKPMDSRRTALGKEYIYTETTLLALLDKISRILASEMDHQDAVVDQLLLIKQYAWMLRNAASEASQVVSASLATGKITPEAGWPTSNPSAARKRPSRPCNCPSKA